MKRMRSLAALRADHENAAAAGFPQRGGTRKSHERTRNTFRTQGPGNGLRLLA